jgi:Bacitracin resistance protein BacA
VVILLAERLVKATRPAEQITWAVAISVGLAQVLAGVFPGTSRTGAAIFAAMFAGLTARGRATEFAFLVGIPTMFAAASYDFALTVADDATFAAESWAQIGIGFAAAAVTGFIAVKWILAFISTNTFVPFAWYRIALGVLLLFAFVPSYHQDALWIVLGIAVAIWVAYVGLTLSRRDAKTATASSQPVAPGRLSEAQYSELALLVARAVQVLEDLGSTRCESEPIRKRAVALQDEIAAWLAANADARAAEMFKSVTGVPGVLSGMAPQYLPLYQRFRGRMKVLRQLARTYTR